jgi:hypothetical protein
LTQSLEEASSQQTFEPAPALISFSRRALDWFRAGDSETKRLILECLGSNPTLTGKILSIQAAKPFSTAANIETIPKLLGVVEDIRTLYAENDPHLLKVLHNIRKLEDKFSRSGPEPASEVCYWRKPRRHHMEPTVAQLREAMNRPPPSDDTPFKLRM